MPIIRGKSVSFTEQKQKTYLFDSGDVYEKPSSVDLKEVKEKPGSNGADDDRAEQKSVVTESKINISFADTEQGSNPAPRSSVFTKIHKTSTVEVPFVATLSRMYNLPSFEWESSDTISVGLASYDFPGALLSQATMECACAGYKYFRAGVRIAFRFNTTKFNYGMIMISCIPNPLFGTASSNIPTNVFDASGQIHYLMDASSSAPLEIELPMVYPKIGFALEDYLSNNRPNSGADFWRVNVMVLNPLNSSADIAFQAITCQVQAQFIAPEVWLPLGVPFSGPPPVERVNRWLHEAIHDVADAHGNEFEMESKQTTTSSFKDRTYKAWADISSAAFSAASTGANAIMRTVVGAATYSLLGLSKPLMETAPHKMVQSKVNDLNYSDGVFLGVRGTTTVSGQVDPHRLVTFDTDEMAMDTWLKRRPMLVQVLTFTDTSSQVFRLTPFACHNDGANDHPTFLAAMTDRHAWWYGSLNVVAVISASPMTSARMRVAYVPHPNVPVSLNVDDCYSQMVQIQGSTTWATTIAYCNDQLMLEAAPDYHDGPDKEIDLGYLRFDFPAGITNSTSAVPPKIFVNLYLTGGEDYGVMYPVRSQRWAFDSTDDTIEAEAQMNPWELFKDCKPFHPSMKTFHTKGICGPPPPKSLKDYLNQMRPTQVVQFAQKDEDRTDNFHLYGALNPFMTSLYHPLRVDNDATHPAIFNVSNNSTSWLWFASYFYRFWSGSLRTGIRMDTEGTTAQPISGTIAAFQNYPGSTNSGFRCHTGQPEAVGYLDQDNPIFTVEFPYYSPHAYQLVATQGWGFSVAAIDDMGSYVQLLPIDSFTSGTYIWYTGVGDDFSFYHLKAPGPVPANTVPIVDMNKHLYGPSYYYFNFEKDARKQQLLVRERDKQKPVASQASKEQAQKLPAALKSR